jgi:TonB family protein
MKKACFTFVALIAIGLVMPALAGEHDDAVAFDKDTGMTEPVKIAGASPSYPESARKDKVQGIVVLKAIIDTKGDVVQVTTTESPDERLTVAATNAVKTWRFKPALDAGGDPIKVSYLLTIKFNLS